MLNDFPGTGNPTKLIQYDLAGPVDIPAIQILTGNNGQDGRVISTTVIEYSTDGGSSYMPLGPNGGYFQSDPSGTINDAVTNGWRATLVRITDDQGVLISGATNLRFDFYAVHHNDNTMQDPFVGVNPFTNEDDEIANNNEGPITSPLVLEIDVTPEPSTFALLLGTIGLLVIRRRK